MLLLHSRVSLLAPIQNEEDVYMDLSLEVEDGGWFRVRVFDDCHVLIFVPA